MDYRIGNYERDEALAQSCRQYLHDCGEQKTIECAARYQRKAIETEEAPDGPWNRYAEALRDAIQNAKETKAA